MIGSSRVLVMLLQTAVVLDLWTWFDLGFSPQLFVGSCPRWLKISAGRSATCVFRVRVEPEIRSPAGGMPRRNQEKLNYWESPKELQYCMTKAYRHGAYSHRGRLSRGGWIKMSESADLFQITVGQLWDALALEENSGQKKRFEVSRGWIRAAQGHSSDSGLRHPSDVYLEVQPRTPATNPRRAQQSLPTSETMRMGPTLGAPRTSLQRAKAKARPSVIQCLKDYGECGAVPKMVNLFASATILESALPEINVQGSIFVVCRIVERHILRLSILD